jgi:hypothetical protein
LIEKSHLGGTVAEACESQLSDLVKNHCHSSADAAALLVKAGVMALFSHATRLTDVTADAINNDHSFVSLADCIKSLSFLSGIGHILRIQEIDRLREIETQALERIIPMVPGLTAVDEKEDFALAGSVKMIYQIAARENFVNAYTEALVDLISSKNVPPSVDGSASGLLFNAGKLSLEQTLGRANAYFTATGDILAMSGRFLRGLFLTAKDLVFYDNGFIGGLNNTVKNLPYDDFIKLLPDLRLSFTTFSPREIDLLAKKVLTLMGLSEERGISLTTLPSLDERELRLMEGIDRKAMQLVVGSRAMSQQVKNLEMSKK